MCFNITFTFISRYIYIYVTIHHENYRRIYFTAYVATYSHPEDFSSVRRGICERIDGKIVSTKIFPRSAFPFIYYFRKLTMHLFATYGYPKTFLCSYVLMNYWKEGGKELYIREFFLLNSFVKL